MGSDATTWPEQRWLGERGRLVRLCALLTGNGDIAEDLTQETLLEAWRHLDSLRDAEHFSAWLSGIAKHVCLRWRHAQQRQVAPQCLVSLDDVVADEMRSDSDTERDLERLELIAALNHALAQLPHDVRDLLLAHYVTGYALRELAAQQQINEKTVAKRLQRGKLAFRHMLANDPEQWRPYLVTAATPLWEPTPIWCPLCGKHPWRAQRVAGMIHYACPHCHRATLPEITTRDTWNAKGYKRILAKMMTWVEATYRPFLAAAARPCPQCGLLVPLVRQRLTLQLHCPRCHTINENTVPMLALGSAEGRAFWRSHPRLQLQPIREGMVAGQRATLVTYRDITSRAAFEATFAADTFALLAAQTVQ